MSLTNSDPSLLEVTSQGASLILSSESEDLIGQAEVTLTVTSAMTR